MLGPPETQTPVRRLEAITALPDVAPGDLVAISRGRVAAYVTSRQAAFLERETHPA